MFLKFIIVFFEKHNYIFPKKQLSFFEKTTTFFIHQNKLEYNILYLKQKHKKSNSSRNPSMYKTEVIVKKQFRFTTTFSFDFFYAACICIL